MLDLPRSRQYGLDSVERTLGLDPTFGHYSANDPRDDRSGSAAPETSTVATFWRLTAAGTGTSDRGRRAREQLHRRQPSRPRHLAPIAWKTVINPDDRRRDTSVRGIAFSVAHRFEGGLSVTLNA